MEVENEKLYFFTILLSFLHVKDSIVSKASMIRRFENE